jgi:predicted nucleotidyltransferase component of viral defense system
MIDRIEIMELSKEFGLAANTVEKDYVLGWLLAGIYNHKTLRKAWVFKGGTCLKKCFFETYRFSEDLDFTLHSEDLLSESSLIQVFQQVTDWINDQSGIELPHQAIKFEIYTNPRGKKSAQGRIAYRGPLMTKGDLPRIKLDLTADELMILPAVRMPVHHPYSDAPPEGILAACYSYEEIFAEKLRALAERERPRDLYDVIHLYRHANSSSVIESIRTIFNQKCAFKGIKPPTVLELESSPAFVELKSEWANMLAHQLPALPPFDSFWKELPLVFDWLEQKALRPPLTTLATASANEDTAWRPPALMVPWGMSAPIEVIRYAAANHLCIDLRYENRNRLIEPYALRRTLDGHILLHAIKQATGEHRSYRLDRIQQAAATTTPFVPKYAIEI